MSIRGRVYAAVVAVVVVAAVPVGVLSMSASAPAGASTAACGSACTSLSVESEGTSMDLTVTGSASSGYSVGLAAASDTNTGQDFSPVAENTVGNDSFYGFVPNKWNVLYSSGYLLEYQFAPGGIASGYCLADGVTQETVVLTPPDQTDESGIAYVPNTSVTMAPCGISLQTVWMIDPNTQALVGNGYTDLINMGYAVEPKYDDTAAASTGALMSPPTSSLVSPFAEPEVLAYSGGKLVLQQLSEVGSTVSTSQMWTGLTASGQPELRAALAKAAQKAKKDSPFLSG